MPFSILALSQLAFFYTVSTFSLHLVYLCIFYNFPHWQAVRGMPELYAVCPRKGDTMEMAGAGTGHTSINTKIHFFPAYTAAHEGTAVFFCSTHFRLKPVHNPKYHIILKKSASALKRVRFFNVGKRLFLSFCHARAPPLRF